MSRCTAWVSPAMTSVGGTLITTGDQASEENRVHSERLIYWVFGAKAVTPLCWDRLSDDGQDSLKTRWPKRRPRTVSHPKLARVLLLSRQEDHPTHIRVPTADPLHNYRTIQTQVLLAALYSSPRLRSFPLRRDPHMSGPSISADSLRHDR